MSRWLWVKGPELSAAAYTRIITWTASLCPPAPPASGTAAAAETERALPQPRTPRAERSHTAATTGTGTSALACSVAASSASSTSVAAATSASASCSAAAPPAAPPAAIVEPSRSSRPNDEGLPAGGSSNGARAAGGGTTSMRTRTKLPGSDHENEVSNPTQPPCVSNHRSAFVPPRTPPEMSEYCIVCGRDPLAVDLRMLTRSTVHRR